MQKTTLYRRLPKKEAKNLQSEITTQSEGVAERRASPCVCGPFPAVVLDMADCEEGLGVQTTLDDIGADGFRLRLNRQVETGDKLLVVTKIAEAVVVLRGVVTRAEKLEDGSYELAVATERHQIFSLKTNHRQPQTKPPDAVEFLTTEA